MDNTAMHMDGVSFLSGVIISAQAQRKYTPDNYLYCVYTFQIDDGQKHHTGVGAAGQQFIMSYIAELAMDKENATTMDPTAVPTMSNDTKTEIIIASVIG